MSGRTFVVGVYVGRRIVPWPFGRLNVNDYLLSLRSRPAFQFRKREAFKGSVEAISIYKRSGANLIKIRDTENEFSRIIVQIPLGSAKLLDELRRCGYTVTDRRL